MGGRGRGRGARNRARGRPPLPHAAHAARREPLEEDADEAALAEAIRLSLAETESDPEEEDLRQAIQASLRSAGLRPEDAHHLNPLLDHLHPDQSAIDKEPDHEVVDANDDEPSSSTSSVVKKSHGVRSTRSSRYRAQAESAAKKNPSPPSPNGSNSALEIDLNEEEDEEMEGPSSTQTMESRSKLEIQIVTAAQGGRGKNPVFGRVETYIRNAFDNAELPSPTIKKMEILMSNANLERDFHTCQQNLNPSENVPSLLFHAAEQAKLGSEFVLKHNLSCTHSTGRKPYGPGLYFTALPSIQDVSEFAVLVCQVLKGKEFLDDTSAPIPNEFHSKSVDHGGNLSEDQGAVPTIGPKMIHVIPDSNQICPLAIVHCSFSKKALQGWGGRELRHKLNWFPKEAYSYDFAGQLHAITHDVSQTAQVSDNGGSTNTILNDDQVAKQLREMFEPSLQLHENGKYLKACQAIKTKLYPHQMFALAWMAHRENNKMDGVRGGILADDMGLGKTLSILALILGNFHDSRPMARPQPGFTRVLNKEVQRYLPPKLKARGPDQNECFKKALKEVGRKCASVSNSANLDLSKMMGVMARESKDRFQKVKSSKKAQPEVFFVKSLNDELEELDESLIDQDDSDDEFDSMIMSGSKSLSEKLGFNSEKVPATKSSSVVLSHFHDGLSDDEEYQNMSEQERNNLLRPSLNLDGAHELSTSESEPDLPESTSDGVIEKRKRNKRSQSKFQPPSKSKKIYDDILELPDINTPSLEPEPSKPTKESFSPSQLPDQTVPSLTDEEKKRLVIPRRDPAICGTRRRATLLVTPSSLISHWIEQIETHVDKRVELKVFVHHGLSKALIGNELEDQDVVITTYGTLMSEYNTSSSAPLLKCRWLRVCLDEGHQIKNYRAKTSKAALELDTQRKWIISGTPIQNNLSELWSLLSWLELEPYATSRSLFKQQIETPVKQGHPHAIQRLQTVVRAICLRRTKNDQINGKPLVNLPNKTVEVQMVDFKKEEKIVYDAYLSHGREIIARYMRRGTLLKNYAHVFAVMMRLRQLACHRDLLPVDWKDINLNELDELAKKDLSPPEAMNPEQAEHAKRLAEQLRDMIRNGISDECAICLGDFDHPVITPCGHIYCKPCITTHIEALRPPALCPLCRGDILASQLLEAAPNDEDDSLDDKDLEDFEDIVVEESSSKINALIKQMELDRSAAKPGKVIIVSQFTSLLSIVQPILTDRNFSWIRLDGSMNSKQRSAVVAEFQDKSQDTAEVLLLSLRAGGVGLNLTAATRLFLLDPAWNPSTEEQCFDRIHRLGQKLDVKIIKFIMKDSIEERMMAIQEKKRDLISGAFRQNEAERRQQRIQDIRDVFGL
ncbi:helicase-like transcription factor isoform X2 [Tigriopus californicus]|uniref:helicase-like transcription factor isoform X2 n=1 Tax=Tigriopus californicus TaxID=6832 RepID=UPI0027D9F0A4|nr:helicase-like transcription factor isoform X2 [Tigriopus californicus]